MLAGGDSVMDLPIDQLLNEPFAKRARGRTERIDDYLVSQARFIL